MELSLFKKRHTPSDIEPIGFKKELKVPPPPPPPTTMKSSDLPKFTLDSNEPEKEIAPPVLKDHPIIPSPIQSDLTEIDLRGYEGNGLVFDEMEHYEPSGHEILEPKQTYQPKPVPTPKSLLQIKPMIKLEPEQQPAKLAQKITPDGGLYVNVKNYRQIVDDINDINSALHSLGSTTQKIDEFRSKEAEAFRSWYSGLESMRKKLVFVDEVLFEG